MTQWVTDCGVECHQASSLWLHSCLELVLIIATRLMILEKCDIESVTGLVIAVNLVIVLVTVN